MAKRRTLVVPSRAATVTDVDGKRIVALTPERQRLAEEAASQRAKDKAPKGKKITAFLGTKGAVTAPDEEPFFAGRGLGNHSVWELHDAQLAAARQYRRDRGMDDRRDPYPRPNSLHARMRSKLQNMAQRFLVLQVPMEDAEYVTDTIVGSYRALNESFIALLADFRRNIENCELRQYGIFDISNNAFAHVCALGIEPSDPSSRYGDDNYSSEDPPLVNDDGTDLNLYDDPAREPAFMHRVHGADGMEPYLLFPPRELLLTRTTQLELDEAMLPLDYLRR